VIQWVFETWAGAYVPHMVGPFGGDHAALSDRDTIGRTASSLYKKYLSARNRRIAVENAIGSKF
jgi:hypothetical protein